MKYVFTQKNFKNDPYLFQLHLISNSAMLDKFTLKYSIGDKRIREFYYQGYANQFGHYLVDLINRELNEYKAKHVVIYENEDGLKLSDFITNLRFWKRGEPETVALKVKALKKKIADMEQLVQAAQDTAIEALATASWQKDLKRFQDNDDDDLIELIDD